MTGWLSGAAHLLNSLLMIGLPLVLGAWAARRLGLGWRLFWIGAATFLLSQAAHIPANLLIGRLFAAGWLPTPAPPWQAPVFAAIAGLSAGVFEEGARYATLRWWARDARSWGRAVILGCGHGGAEAILLGVLAFVSFAAMLAYRGADLESLVDAKYLELARRQIGAYWSMPWHASLLGAVERALTLPIQVGLSVLVLQCFTRRQVRWLFLAIAWHAAVDGVIAGYVAPRWLARGAWAPYAVEGLLAAATAASLALIVALRRGEPVPVPEPAGGGRPVAVPAPRALTLDLPETPERLEDTRYHD